MNVALRPMIHKELTRFIVPVTIIGILKIAGLIILHIYFASLGFTIPPKVNVPGLADGYPTRFPDLYLLTNWDSGWYLLIARYGYTEVQGSVRGVPSNYFPTSLNFFPGYPAAIRIVTLFLNDWVLSASLISIAAGLCCVVVWQSISEDYLTRRDAAAAALLTFLFPPAFLMTTIAYSESMYLLMALLSWRFLTRDKLWKASAFAGIASIVRPYGIIAMVPVIRRAWRQHNRMDWAAVLISLLPLASWLGFGYERTFRLLAYSYAHFMGWPDDPTVYNLASQILAGKTIPSLLNSWPWLTAFDALTIVTLVFAFGLFIYQTMRRDKELGYYGLVQYLAITVLANLTVLLRYFGAIFPAWSIFWRRWRAPVLIPLCLLFFLGAMYLWQQFLIGGRAP